MTTEREMTPDDHSSIVGGSSAARILGCPGSVDLLAKIPEVIRNESSDYADEGTALHEVLAYLVDNDITLDHTLLRDPKIDEIFERWDVKEERFFDAVLPALRSFNKVLDEVYAEHPDAELRLRVENRVEMPGIEGAFGTCDVLIRTPNKTIVWDWKFGAGVPVYASYRRNDPQGNIVPDLGAPYFEYGNEQLMFYARAARYTFPDYFDTGDTEFPAEWPVELIICQPRIGEGKPSRFTVTVAELEEFRLDLVDAVEEALSGKGELAIGSYCRFAKCKTICPLHRGAPAMVVDLGAKLRTLQTTEAFKASLSTSGSEADKALVETLNGQTLTYAQALGMMLRMREIAEPYFLEAEAQAHAFMEAGGIIVDENGQQLYKLVPKKAGWDKWQDEAKVDSFLGRQGLSVDERRVVKPITPAVARTKLKALGNFDVKKQKALEKYVQPGVSSGTTIAPTDDARQEIPATSTAVRELANKIGTLSGR